MDLRDHYQPLTNDAGGLEPNEQGCRVRILHPGYHDDGFENLLLDLLASDPSPGGLHHATVLTICGIVTGNRWDGYLSTSNGPEGRVQTPLNAVLAARTYYFLLPLPPNAKGDDEPPYPICPSFREWKFPHNNLPPLWKVYSQAPSITSTSVNNTTQQTEAVKSRDETCRLTNNFEGLEVAHIIPLKEDYWFTTNYMHNYNRDKHRNKTVTNVSNLFLLRSDIHTVYDMHKWTIVPKESRADQGRPKLVFHQLKQSTELSQLYHNKQIHPIGGVSIEYLLARFAHAIFPELAPFLSGVVPRLLITVTENNRQVKRWYTRGDLVTHSSARDARERSNSPKKRKGQDNSAAAAMEETPHKRKHGEYDTESCQQTATPSSSASSLSPKRLKRTVSSAPTETTSTAKPSQQSCTCEDLSLAPASSASSAHASVPSRTISQEKIPIPCPSPFCRIRAEWDRHATLTETYLAAERAKSETGENWKRELEWAKQAMEGKGGMDGDAIRRWFWVMGNDNYMENDGLSFVSTR